MKKGGGKWCTAKRCNQVCFVGRTLWLGLAMFLGSSFLPAFSQDSSPPAVVWFADHTTLVQVDPKTDQTVLTIGLPAESDALVVDPADGSAWLLANRRLLKVDRSGVFKQEIDLRSLSQRISEPKHLLLNPHDSSLWIAGERVVLRLNANGGLANETTLSDSVRSAALDLDDHGWVLTENQLIRLSPGLVVQSTQNLRSLLASPRHVAVDRLGKRLWLAGNGELLAFDSANLAQPLLRIALATALRIQGNAGKVDALAVHPVFGTVWAVARQTLLLYDRQGQPLKQIPLSSYDLGEIEAMVYDPIEFGLWLGGKKALGHFRSTGDFVARLPVQNELEALAATPFRLRPTLSLLAPPDRAVTNNALTPLRYGLGSDCTGTPCYLEPDYTRSFALSVDVDGQVIGSRFTLGPDEALYTPSIRWPEGSHQVEASATDRYGHKSEKVTSRFTVDTIPPQFVSVTPADGSVMTNGAVTIQGSADDPAASVMLYDASGAMVSMAGAQFAFSVLLRPGWNVFSLLARDRAGNEASVPVRLYLNVLDATLTSIVPGSTVNTDALSLAGTFLGPENTGITVNGIVAFTDGQNFYVNNLPLIAGENTLTIIVTGPDGKTITKTVTVTSSSPSPLRVEVEPQVGLAPLATRFRLSYGGSGIVTGYTLDVDGDGIVDDAGSDIPLPLAYTYPTPGLYRPRITLTDSTGKTYNQTLAVLVQDPARVDEFFTRLWNGMNTALAGGNLPAALNYLNVSARNKYQPVFEALRPNLAQIVGSYSPPARLSVSESIGEYAVSRPYQGRIRVYLVYFLKDVDGVWRVDEM